MDHQEASQLLGRQAGRLISTKVRKAYTIFVWEGGVTKVMGSQRFGWHPDYSLAHRGAEKNAVAVYYFALDNKHDIDNTCWPFLMRVALTKARQIIKSESDTIAHQRAVERRRAMFHVVTGMRK